jgi:zinc/manganese transport system substrate-binding protein
LLFLLLRSQPLRLLLCLPLLLALGAGPAHAADKLKAVASFSILADLVRQVGGDRVEVSALVGPDSDAHAFQPSPADARRLKDARLVVVNGLGLDAWMERLLRASGSRAPAVVASRGVAPIREEAHGSQHGLDPHAWQDVANARIYVANIRDGLVAADPDGRTAYEANATAYLARLEELDREVRAGIAAIPPGRREVITTHDAFGYFARAYGMTFTAPEGVSTESEASAADVARIIRQIRARKVPAVFLENVSDPRLIGRVAAESGAKIGGRLYSDALSAEGGPASTYLDMMRANLAALRGALAE